MGTPWTPRGRTGRKGEGVFHRNQEGANALEFALVLPLLIVLIFGAFSVALGYDLRLGSAHAARDGARYGATLADAGVEGGAAPADGWFEDIRDRIVAASTGQLGPGLPDTLICVAYVRGEADATPDLDTTASRARWWASNGGTWTELTSDADVNTHDDKQVDRWDQHLCEQDGLGDAFTVGGDLQERVQVLVWRDFDFNVVMLPVRTIQVEVNAVARYERLDD